MATSAKKASPKKKMQKGGSSKYSGDPTLASANTWLDKYVRNPINEAIGNKPKAKAKAAVSKAASSVKKSKTLVAKKMQMGGALKDSSGQAVLRSWNAALGLRDSDTVTRAKESVARERKKVASAKGYKKQMGGTASTKSMIDPLGKNPGSCKSGKCAPGMRGTKGMGRAKSNFSKKKFKLS